MNASGTGRLKPLGSRLLVLENWQDDPRGGLALNLRVCDCVAKRVTRIPRPMPVSQSKAWPQVQVRVKFPKVSPHGRYVSEFGVPARIT